MSALGLGHFASETKVRKLSRIVYPLGFAREVSPPGPHCGLHPSLNHLINCSACIKLIELNNHKLVNKAGINNGTHQSIDLILPTSESADCMNSSLFITVAKACR